MKKNWNWDRSLAKIWSQLVRYRSYLTKITVMIIHLFFFHCYYLYLALLCFMENRRLFTFQICTSVWEIIIIKSSKNHNKKKKVSAYRTSPGGFASLDPHYYFFSLWLKLKKQGTCFSHLVGSFMNKLRPKTIWRLFKKR